MPVRDTSKEALEKIQQRLPRIAQRVFKAILEIGPTHNNRILEYLNQKEAATLKPKYLKRKWQINQICGRVNELVHTYCIVEDLGPHRGTWYGEKKTYHLWRVIGDERRPIGWISVPEKTAEHSGSTAEQRVHLQQKKREKLVLMRIEQRLLFA